MYELEGLDSRLIGCTREACYHCGRRTHYGTCSWCDIGEVYEEPKTPGRIEADIYMAHCQALTEEFSRKVLHNYHRAVEARKRIRLAGIEQEQIDRGEA